MDNLGRILTVSGLAVLIIACTPADAGGKKMSSIPWKELWRGSGPSWSPDGAPPGLSVVHGKAAWTRVIAAYGPPADELAKLPVDWKKDLILFLQATESDPSAKLVLKSLTADDTAGVALTATLEAGPPDQTTLGVSVRPWLIVSAPAAAFSGNRTVKYVLDGRGMPVVQER